MCEDIDYPVYGTQGGGLAQFKDGKAVFIEAPKDFPELKVGDEVPERWDLQPANDAAHQAAYEDDLDARHPEEM